MSEPVIDTFDGGPQGRAMSSAAYGYESVLEDVGAIFDIPPQPSLAERISPEQNLAAIIKDNHKPTPAEQHLAALLHAGITSAELLSKTFAPRKWLVPGLLPAWGMTVLGAKMGVGKSFFLLQLAAALSTGTPFLGQETERQGVLFITLEDDEQTVQERMNGLGIVGTDKLLIYTRWAKGKDALADLRLVLTEHPKIHVAIIDPIVKFIDLLDFNDYGGAYGALGPIKDTLDDRNVVGIFSHHAKKAISELDAFDDLLGSTAWGAACDTRAVLRLPRGSDEGTLVVIGRGVRYSKSALLFDAEHGWQYQGTAEAVRMSDERREILDLLEETGPLSAAEISRRLQKADSTVRTLLRKLQDKGNVVQGSDRLWKGRNAVAIVTTPEQENATVATLATVATEKREREERETLTTGERGEALPQSTPKQEQNSSQADTFEDAPRDNFDDDLEGPP